jgi:hypothetical protein
MEWLVARVVSEVDELFEEQNTYNLPNYPKSNTDPGIDTSVRS